jgi:hypothetical protein
VPIAGRATAVWPAGTTHHRISRAFEWPGAFAIEARGALRPMLTPWTPETQSLHHSMSPRKDGTRITGGPRYVAVQSFFSSAAVQSRAH